MLPVPLRKHACRPALIMALALLPAPAFLAAAPDLTRSRPIVPDAIPGVETLTAEEVVRRAIADDTLIIIDSRISKDRTHGYIEGSVSLPDIHTHCDSLSAITADRRRALLFYCNGVRCGRSVVAIKVALSCGYRNLSWFRGGFEEWKEKGYQYVTD